MFLLKADFETLIKSGILDEVTEATDTIIDAGQMMAQKEIESYLSQRFDTADLFSKTGNNRNPKLIMDMIDVTLYHIHARINPRFIPDIRRERYLNVIEWLKLAASGKITPDYPTKKDGSGESIGSNFIIGSNDRFNIDY